MKQDIGDKVIKPKHATLAEALAAAQSEVQNPKLDSVNPHFKNRYASLAAVLKAVIPVFSANGISITQDLVTSERGLGCVTTLTHVTGELKFGPLVLPVSKMDAQGFGSAITYARRYSLSAVAGVVGEEDDDGEAAVGQTRSATPQQAAKPIFKMVETAPTNAMTLAKAIAQKLAGSGLLSGHIRSFLESKNAWPKGCQSVPNLPEKVMARLLDESVWAEVVAFKVELMEVSP